MDEQHDATFWRRVAIRYATAMGRKDLAEDFASYYLLERIRIMRAGRFPKVMFCWYKFIARENQEHRRDYTIEQKHIDFYCADDCAVDPERMLILRDEIESHEAGGYAEDIDRYLHPPERPDRYAHLRKAEITDEWKERVQEVIQMRWPEVCLPRSYRSAEPWPLRGRRYRIYFKPRRMDTARKAFSKELKQRTCAAARGPRPGRRRKKVDVLGEGN